MSQLTIDPAAVAANVVAVRQRIAVAAAGRDVELVAVTKGFGPDAVTAAVAAGCRAIGENYAQELLTKREAIDDGRARGPVAVHFIGRLQTNKVRLAAPVVDVWETIDRAPLIRELARRTSGATVLIQVNSTNERAKGGCRPADTHRLVDECTAAGLVVDGLMTIGPLGGDLDAARRAFALVRRQVDELRLRTCSMGMTDDLEVAVAEGSTRVRLGTALFGARPPHD